MRTYRVRIGSWWRDIQATRIRNALLYGVEDWEDEMVEHEMRYGKDYPDISELEVKVEYIRG